MGSCRHTRVNKIIQFIRNIGRDPYGWHFLADRIDGLQDQHIFFLDIQILTDAESQILIILDVADRDLLLIDDLAIHFSELEVEASLRSQDISRFEIRRHTDLYIVDMHLRRSKCLDQRRAAI